MSRGVIYTATYRDLLTGELVIDMPTGYNRIQFNQFTAGAEKQTKDGVWGWIEKPKAVNKQFDIAGALGDGHQPIYIHQTAPINATYATDPKMSLILKVFCIGIDAQSPVVAAAKVGDTIQLGMNGNPYKVTNRTVRIYVTNELDQIVNNLGIIIQYTLL